MNIGMITERMILGFGVDLVVHETATRLVAMGHKVTVFAIRVDSAYPEVNYGIFNLREKVEHHENVSSYQFMSESIAFLKTFEIDAWVIHTPPFYDWLVYLKTPVIIQEYGTPNGHFFSKEIGEFLDNMTRHRFTHIYKSLRYGDTITSISNSIHMSLPESVRKHSTPVLLGGDHYITATDEEAKEFRKEIRVAEDEVMLLWVGRIQHENDEQPYKGLAEFKEMIPEIYKNHNNVKVVMVGRAEESAKALLEDLGVIPIINLSKEKMGVAYRAADILANTSKWEGFNLPLIEAQIQGTPVVAYNLGPHPEVVANGESGLLVNNVKEFIKAVSRLINDDKLRKEFSAEAVKFASGFTWDKNAEEINEIITRQYQIVKEKGLREDDSRNVTPIPPIRIWKAKEIINRKGWLAFFKEAAARFLK